MAERSVGRPKISFTVVHSRPHVSNDNPYSEAQFKTLKYRPDFPEHFGGLEHARLGGRDLFQRAPG